MWMLSFKTQSFLQEQRVVLTTELSLQPPAGSFDVAVCDVGCCEQNSYVIPQTWLVPTWVSLCFGV